MNWALRRLLALLLLASMWNVNAARAAFFNVPMNGEFVIMGNYTGPGDFGPGVYSAVIVAEPFGPGCGYSGCGDLTTIWQTLTTVSGALNASVSYWYPLNTRSPPDIRYFGNFLTNDGDRRFFVSTIVWTDGVLDPGALGIGAFLQIDLPAGAFLVEAPVPAALPLLATGLIVLGWFARRRRVRSDGQPAAAGRVFL